MDNDFDTIVPHKMHIKLKSNVNTTSRKIDFSASAVVNGFEEDLIAQSTGDMDVKGLFKADQDDKDEHVTVSDAEFKSIYLLVDIPPRVLDEFVGGIEVNFIRNQFGGIYLESTNFPEGVYIGSDVLIGFSSMDGINNLISAIQEADSKEDALFIAKKISAAHDRFYNRAIFPDAESNVKAVDDGALWELTRFFGGKKYVLELPLDFGRIESLKKVHIIEGVDLYALSLEENKIDKISLLVKENTITELPPIGPFYFDKKNNHYLVDESLELEAEDNSLIAESVYPDIADSLIFE